MQNIGFSDSEYVIKPPQASSAIHGAPPFTGHLFKVSVKGAVLVSKVRA